MKSRFRISMAVLVGTLGVMSSSLALAQTGPCNENDETLNDCPTHPVDGTGGTCSIAVPSGASGRASGGGVGLAMTLIAAGVGAAVVARRKR